MVIPASLPSRKEARPLRSRPTRTHNLTVRFAPTSGGTKATTLRLTSDDPDEGPIDVALSGVGTTAPDISVAPTSHNYGNVGVGTSVTRSFTVSNTGTGNLVVGASTLTGADAAVFAIVTGQSGFTLAPGASGLIEVSFSPSTQGPKTATLNIPSNDPNETPLLIVLTGAGTVGGGGSTTPTFEEVREGGSANSNTVTTTTSLLGVGGDVYLAAVSSKPYYAVTTRDRLGSHLDATCRAVRRAQSDRPRALVGTGASHDRECHGYAGIHARQCRHQRRPVFRRCSHKPGRDARGRQHQWRQRRMLGRNG